MGKNYLENFVQATFDALKATGVPVEGGTMVVSGDGRFYNKVLPASTYLHCLVSLHSSVQASCLTLDK